MPNAVELVAKVLIQEGAAPGNSLHGWRCEYPERYGPCDCVKQTAQRIVSTLQEADATLVPDNNQQTGDTA